MVSHGGVAPFDGDLDDYQRYLLDEAKRAREAVRQEQVQANKALAAAKAGATQVLAADIDAFSCAAIGLNAAANQLDIAVTQEDIIGQHSAWDVILVGDLFYERPLAERLLAWLAPLKATALLGDPGRSYFPKHGVEKLAIYTVQTTRDLEDREIRETGVYRLV